MVRGVLSQSCYVTTCIRHYVYPSQRVSVTTCIRHNVYPSQRVSVTTCIRHNVVYACVHDTTWYHGMAYQVLEYVRTSGLVCCGEWR